MTELGCSGCLKTFTFTSNDIRYVDATNCETRKISNVSDYMQKQSLICIKIKPSTKMYTNFLFLITFTFAVSGRWCLIAVDEILF